MPKRKHVSIGAVTPNSKRMRIQSEAESPLEREGRLEKMREAARVKRSLEDDFSRRERLNDQAAITARSKALESPLEREGRLQKMREADRVRRSAEADRRIAETPVQRRARLDGVARRKTVKCVGRDGTIPSSFSIGRCDVICEFCSAYRFPSERLFCCENGKVKIEDYFEDFPPQLKNLFLVRNAHGMNFRENIRKFNSAFAFASLGAKITPPPGNGPYCFRVHGAIQHRSGNLHPEPATKPQYGQLYILEGDQAVTERLERAENTECNPEVMQIVQDVVMQVSPYAAAYRNMAEIEAEQVLEAQRNGVPVPTVRMVFRAGRDERRYNEPVHDEVAAVFVGSSGAPPSHTDIVVHPRGSDLRRISYMNGNLDPMLYPLFFPQGQYGWSPELQHTEDKRTRIRNRVSQLEFYNYMTAMRPTFSPIHFGGKLFQQYLVDAYCKVEAGRLNYIALNQARLRADSYQGLLDYVNNGAAECNLPAGRPVILPSSFNGSPRNMHQNFQDAMAMVSKFGRPSLFITMTANPKSERVLNALRPGQTAADRADIITRVFKLELEELLADLSKRGIFGRSVARLHVIEFQKRGLPHAHILIWLDDESRPRDADEVDSIIRAEIPCPEKEPDLHRLVMTHHMHGPCGEMNMENVCMKDGFCSKGFPKPFEESTLIGDAFPRYRRRDNGVKVFVRGSQLHNGFVVPYSPYLLRKFECHCNVELCTSVKAIKYLFKYVFKGHDSASLEASVSGDNNDEIKTYLETRYVSAPEAVWRLSKFAMSNFSHSVVRLAIHIPLHQMVYVNQNEVDSAIQRAANEETTLTAFFKLNEKDSAAREILYSDIPIHYTWSTAKKEWKRRTRGGDKIVSRMYHVSPKDSERFHLRLLLLHVPGATSFQFLKTVNGVALETFREACIARNLLQCDDQYHNALSEASTFHMPHEIRLLFCHLLVSCAPRDPLDLWNVHCSAMSEDFGRNLDEEASEQAALACIHRILKSLGSDAKEFKLPAPVNVGELPTEEYYFSPHDSNMTLEDLNTDQLLAAEAILASLDKGEGLSSRLFFIDAPGGYGKSTMLNVVISEAMSKGFTVASCAWTGCAKELLFQGRTVHQLFKLPVPILDNSVCNVKPVSVHGDYLRSIDLFLIDEISMVDVNAFNAIDQCLRDITQNHNFPFGSKLLVCAGDFRQVLPVVRDASPAEIIEHCVKQSPVWSDVKIFKLTQNMRALPGERDFVDWLIQLGNGTLKSTVCDEDGMIDIPNRCCVDGDISKEIFPDLTDESVYSSVILTPKNDACHELNDEIVSRLPGDAVRYVSTDLAVCENEEEARNYPLEFLHSCTPNGMPCHLISLKAGAVIILLRSIDSRRGLCNGTRLKVLNLKPNVIFAEILTGPRKGLKVFIPRIRLAPSDVNLPFILSRNQFPIRIAFCMTINKAQGATFEKVGLYLEEPVFSHGQLYVAASRTRSFDALRCKIVPTQKQGFFNGQTVTKNVVWQSILN